MATSLVHVFHHSLHDNAYIFVLHFITILHELEKYPQKIQKCMIGLHETKLHQYITDDGCHSQYSTYSSDERRITVNAYSKYINQNALKFIAYFML